MQDNQLNNLSKGIDKDSAFTSFPENRYFHANDVEFVSDKESQITFAQSKLGTTLMANIPKTEELKQIWRVQHYCDTESQALNPDLYEHSSFIFKVLDESDNIIAYLTLEFDSGNPLTFTNFVSSAESGFLSNGIDVSVGIIGDPLIDKFATFTIINRSPLPKIAKIEHRSYTNFTIGFDKTVLLDMLQDEYAADIELMPIAYTNTRNIGFVLSISQDKTFTEIGSLNEYNEINGLWEYRRHLRTKSFVASEDNPIDFTVEQQSDDIYSLYFSDNVLKPKCIYVPSLSQDSCLRYSPLSYQTASKGVYNLTNTDEQTNAQLINNIVHCEYKETIESGGNLTTGGKAYAVRCGISSSSKTEWSFISKTVPVIAQNSASKLSWVAIEGTPIGQPTSKMNVITIKNAKPEVFLFCEVAVIEFTSEKVGTPYIIGEYDITADTFDIVHNGNENYIPVPIEEFVNTDPVILTAKNQKIKRQRINYSNVSIGANDDVFSQIAENAVLDTTRFEISNVGKLANEAGNQRFLGSLSYNEDTTPQLLYSTNTNEKRVLPLISTPILGVTPSTYTSSTATYIVQIEDTPTLQFVLNVNGLINRVPAGFFNMYFVVIKNDEEVGSILLGQRSEIPSGASDYIIDANQVINIPVLTGDTIQFKFQFHSSFGGVGGTNPFFQGDFSLNLYQSTGQNALQFTETKVGEYQIPFNVANRSGYMLNDYRFVYAKPHYKNGFIGAAYPLGKYTEDNLNFIKGLHKAKITDSQAPFTDVDTSVDRKVYNYAISVNNLDITQIKDQLEGISFWVSDDIGAVIGTGIYAIADKIEGDTYSCNLIGTAPPSSIQRNYGMFFSHDTVNKDIQFASGDKLRTYGEPTTFTSNNNFKSGLNFTSRITEYLGYVQTPDLPAFNFLDIEDSKSVIFNGLSDIIYNETLNSGIKLSTSFDKKATLNNQGIAITTTQRSNDAGGGLSNMVQLAQYQRALNILNLSYKNYKPKFTGTLIKIDNSTSNVINELSVYGGDTYTQKTIRKVTYWKDYKVGDNNFVESSFITYYAQNRVNAQLFFTNKQASTKTYNLSGSKSIYSYLFPFSVPSDLVEEQFNYEKSYLAQSDIQNAEVYDFNKPYPSSLKTRCYYSEPKPVGSVYDDYRKIRALNFVDLEQKNGEIVAMFSIGERMLFIQPNLVCSVPYATETLLNNSEAINIYVGNGTVYGRQAVPISMFGATLKSATLEGYNTNGNTQIYWLSKDFKNINRYDYSGAKILTDQNSMRTFFNSNVQFINKEFDVNLIYDINKLDVIVTARACKDYPFWEIGTPYNAGDCVTFVANGYKEPSNFENNLTIYRAINNVASSLNPILDPTNWEFIAYDATNFYNHWTLIFNETRNFFTTFLTPLQKRYFNHNKRILSPKGISSFGRIYEMNTGEVLQFFEEDGDFKQGQFEIEVVSSKGLGLKRYLATMLENGKNETILATVSNETDTLSTIANEWEQRGVKTYYPVQPTLDESLQGSWLKTKIVSQVEIVIRSVANFWSSFI